jgi:hypothetical protein
MIEEPADAAADAADAAAAAADAAADAAAARYYGWYGYHWYVRPRYALWRYARWFMVMGDKPNPWRPIVEMYKLGCAPIGYARVNGEVVFVVYAPEVA